MNINRKSKIVNLKYICILIGIFASCNDNVYQEEIPYAFFEDIRIELDLPQYNDLAVDKGYIELNEGIRGIIVYRENASTYHAYERICSFHPSDACATINMHTSRFYLFCPCCNSTFSLTTGYPSGGGPAQFPLRKYQVHLDRRTLIITDEPVGG